MFDSHVFAAPRQTTPNITVTQVNGCHDSQQNAAILTRSPQAGTPLNWKAMNGD